MKSKTGWILAIALGLILLLIVPGLFFDGAILGGWLRRHDGPWDDGRLWLHESFGLLRHVDDVVDTGWYTGFVGGWHGSPDQQLDQAGKSCASCVRSEML